jgi:hypothetical protein
MGEIKSAGDEYAEYKYCWGGVNRNQIPRAKEMRVLKQKRSAENEERG